MTVVVFSGFICDVIVFCLVLWECKLFKKISVWCCEYELRVRCKVLYFVDLVLIGEVISCMRRSGGEQENSRYGRGRLLKQNANRCLLVSILKRLISLSA